MLAFQDVEGSPRRTPSPVPVAQRCRPARCWRCRSLPGTRSRPGPVPGAPCSVVRRPLPRPRSPLSQIITGCRPRRSEASFQVTVQAIADNRPLSATGLRRCMKRRTVMVYVVQYTIRRCPMTEKRDPPPASPRRVRGRPPLHVQGLQDRGLLHRARRPRRARPGDRVTSGRS